MNPSRVDSSAPRRLEKSLFSAAVFGLLGLLSLFSEAQAQTGMGFGGGSDNALQGVLIFTALIVYGSLVLIGFFNALMVLFPSRSLPEEHRRVLRWVGINWLEPNITSGLVLSLFVMNARFFIARSVPSPWSGWWFLLPVLSLMPPLFFRSSDKAAQTVWRALKRSTLARVGMIALTFVGVGLKQPWLALGAPVVGLGVLAWSTVSLMKIASQLQSLEPQPSSARTQTDAV
jgi:hypothetical protein